MLAAGAGLPALSDRHAIETATLPRDQYDPFDRMLIAEARLEKLRAVSADKAWRDHELDLVVV